jgi:hypothetical protein
MASYYEALPIYKAAMVAVRVDSVVQRFAKRHKYRESEQEKPR